MDRVNGNLLYSVRILSERSATQPMPHYNNRFNATDTDVAR